MLVAGGEDVPRLSAVIERQRRELARVRAGHEATAVVGMARGVLMERHGWSSAEAARPLAAMAEGGGGAQGGPGRVIGWGRPPVGGHGGRGGAAGTRDGRRRSFPRTAVPVSRRPAGLSTASRGAGPPAADRRPTGRAGRRRGDRAGEGRR